MMVIPRLALAVPTPEAEPTAASLGLMAGLAELGWRVQHFRARACLTETRAIGEITGLPGRHLDAWLMPAEVCQKVFAQGAGDADLAIVEGTLDSPEAFGPLECDRYGRPGHLGSIVRSLNLPTVATIACPRRDGLHLPRLPQEVDAVLIDQLEAPEDYSRIADAIRLVLRRPVIGAVEALPAVRRSLAATPRDRWTAEDLVAPLGRSFRRFADLDALAALARSRELPVGCSPPEWHGGPRFRVAYAQDEAFGGYFPDTLETLEALGADLVEFSPLRSEALPEDADLVMIGCGYPDQHADALSANVSIMEALRAHFYCGRRIYSEGSGTAYLGRSYHFGGREVAGVGILPIDAVLFDHPPAPLPVTVTLEADTWLGAKGTVVRGYNAGRWQLRPTSELCHCRAGFGPLAEGADMYYHHHAVGSLVHLHFAALPQVVAAFAGPHRPSLTRRQANR